MTRHELTINDITPFVFRHAIASESVRGGRLRLEAEVHMEPTAMRAEFVVSLSNANMLRTTDLQAALDAYNAAL